MWNIYYCWTRCSHFCDVTIYHGNRKALQNTPYFGFSCSYLAQKWSAGQDETLCKVWKNSVEWIQSYQYQWLHSLGSNPIHLYHSAAILESVGNKGFVFVLSLPAQPHIEWEVRRAKSLVWTWVIWVYWSPEFFRLNSLWNCLNCVHNCEDDSFTWFHIHSSICDTFQTFRSCWH